MARYIDLEELERRIKKNIKPETPEEKPLIEWCKDECIRQGYAIPTAEVVPKSEVEALQEALSKAEADVKNYMKVAEYQQSLSVKRYHEIKRLNEDVDRLQEINNNQVENIRLAKQEVVREIFAEIESMLIRYTFDDDYISLGIIDEFSDFKKKYTEEKT